LKERKSKMDRIRINYKDGSAIRQCTDYIKKYIKDKEEIVLVCIGTDRVLGDSLSPLVGTILKERNFSLPIYGTIHEPMHALNLENRYSELKKKHPNAFIIGSDACLGDDDCVGEIVCRDYPVSPGKGVGKNHLPQVGDISIIGIVDSSDNCELFTNRTIRLSLVYDMAKIIADSLILAVEEIKLENNNKRSLHIA
jgi:putative sporulation protein YyaC